MVNARAKVAVEELAPALTEAVTLAHIAQAREILIDRRETHLDSLGERLREERVRRVIEPILSGDALFEAPDDDRRFVLDLGLVRKVNGGNLEIANPIYREVIPRVLAGSVCGRSSAGGRSTGPLFLPLDGDRSNFFRVASG